jgi:uncharacterized protein with HEPN domain
MDKRDTDRLKRIKMYCDRIISSVDRFGNSYEIFLEGHVFFDSVSMKLMRIGEIAKGLAESFKLSTGERIPWSAMIGMSGCFAHKCLAMDKKDIWKTAIEGVPVLSRFCQETLDSQPTC